MQAAINFCRAISRITLSFITKHYFQDGSIKMYVINGWVRRDFQYPQTIYIFYLIILPSSNKHTRLFYVPPPIIHIFICNRNVIVVSNIFRGIVQIPLTEIFLPIDMIEGFLPLVVVTVLWSFQQKYGQWIQRNSFQQQ